ncbi:GTP cyclohydrolase II-domain-containing protein [Phellopilus nigrolimitatus]|nr:GTP cyclohydrolase II-domain-containing protein [Phellopilus nigrolimitatus]
MAKQLAGDRKLSLSSLTTPSTSLGNERDEKAKGVGRKDDAFDPLLLAAAICSGPHVTRHHYHHSFFPSAEDAEAFSWDWSDGMKFVSRQAPRSAHLGLYAESGSEDSSRSPSVSPVLKPADGEGNAAYKLSLSPLTISRTDSTSSELSSPSSDLSDLIGTIGDVGVKCMVRTRVPTPHGEVFLHLYHNDLDNKEHLAIVVDPAQLDAEEAVRPHAPFIRSKSLDAVWHDDETPMERVTRGAYVGRLSEAGYKTSTPFDAETKLPNVAIPAPLVRIHSECFTGETIGSMRCDCGEQLDEALRRIAQPITFIHPDTGGPMTIPGRGAVIYMRQEGRGIGLLSKLRAYNLQDLGHDTVQANLLLGHGADERGYEISAAILHDLGLGVGAGEGGEELESVRLLTNNPDKVEKLADAGVRVAERVSMVPRTWQCQAEGSDDDDAAARLRSAGATLIGASAARGPELEKYLRTKVLRMGHMLSLPSSETVHDF